VAGASAPVSGLVADTRFMRGRPPLGRRRAGRVCLVGKARAARGKRGKRGDGGLDPVSVGAVRVCP